MKSCSDPIYALTLICIIQMTRSFFEKKKMYVYKLIDDDINGKYCKQTTTNRGQFNKKK